MKLELHFYMGSRMGFMSHGQSCFRVERSDIENIGILIYRRLG